MSDTEPEITEEQVADAQADEFLQVEPTEPEPDEQPDDEPEPEPDTGAETSATIEKRGKQFDALRKHVARRTGEILGDDIQVVAECPLCTYFNMPGYIDLRAPDEEFQTLLLPILGMHRPADYKHDLYSRMCENCNGEGEVETGSKVPGQQTLPCFDCKAKGWVAIGSERVTGFPVVENGPSPALMSPEGELVTSSVVAQPISPEAEALRQQGYVVIPPYAPAQ